MYTTILHPLRKAYNLSISEYCVLDTIYLLSNNQKYGGWCVASKEHIADVLDISERKVFTVIKTLEAKELVEKNDQGFLRTLDEWNEKLSNKGDYYVAFNGKESSFATGKPLKHRQKPSNSAEFADNMQKLQGGMQNLQTNSAEFADNIYKENNTNNNTLSKDKEEKPIYGNKDINNMLIALKSKIGVEDFADSSQWARIYAKHCCNLMAKIGKDQFVYRLDVILKDDFKRKNCNKIKYVYGELKGFIEPSVKKQIII